MPSITAKSRSLFLGASLLASALEAGASEIAAQADRMWQLRQQTREQLFDSIPDLPPHSPERTLSVDEARSFGETISADDTFGNGSMVDGSIIGGSMVGGSAFERPFSREPFDAERLSNEAPLERFKRGFFQRAGLNASWIGGDTELEISSWEASVSVAIPLGSFENLLVVTPQFRADYLSGPAMPDVPGELYEAGATLFWRKTLSSRWSASAMAAPMVRSDFVTDQDGLRVFGLGLLSWYWIPDELKLSFGAVYLDRNDIALLPAVGLEWTPQPWWKLELLFPRPRLAYRLTKDGARSETWCYLGGALGGNTWAVQRTDGSSDELSLRDFRLVAGIERLRAGGGGYFAEAGWVFGRRLEYESQPLEVEFQDAWIVRGGVAF